MVNYCQTFSLDEETSDFINNFKWESKISKSEVLRKILRFFIENPEKLKEIVAVE